MQAFILIGVIVFIFVLVLKTISWQTYSEKRVLFQMESFIVVAFRGPLLLVSCVLILDNFLTVSDIENTYLQYLSVISSIASSVILLQ